MCDGNPKNPILHIVISFREILEALARSNKREINVIELLSRTNRERGQALVLHKINYCKMKIQHTQQQKTARIKTALRATFCPLSSARQPILFSSRQFFVWLVAFRFSLERLPTNCRRLLTYLPTSTHFPTKRPSMRFFAPLTRSRWAYL